MIIRIRGKKYKFEIVSEDGQDKHCFFIRAICKFSKRASCINNLNTILSEFNVDPVKPKFADSVWEVSKKEANRFLNTAKEFLSDSLFIKYLEKKLDEDREAGEWANRT